MRKPASPPTARAGNWILVRRTTVVAGSFGIDRVLLLFHASIRLLVARLVMDDTVRIDDDHLILASTTTITVARAFPVSAPPIAARQVDVELRVG